MIKKGRVAHTITFTRADFPALFKKYEELTTKEMDGVKVTGLFHAWALPILERAAQNLPSVSLPSQSPQEPPNESQAIKNLRKWAE